MHHVVRQITVSAGLVPFNPSHSLIHKSAFLFRRSSEVNMTTRTGAEDIEVVFERLENWIKYGSEGRPITLRPPRPLLVDVSDEECEIQEVGTSNDAGPAVDQERRPRSPSPLPYTRTEVAIAVSADGIAHLLPPPPPLVHKRLTAHHQRDNE